MRLLVFNKAIVLTIALFTFSAAVLAQATGNISGTVADANGGSLPGAIVKIISVRTGQERSVAAQANGYYTVQNLQPGEYRITASLEGFNTLQVANFELGVGQTRTFDLKLEPGEVTAYVDVVADDFTAASFEQSSNRLGANISAREVKEMPVNGRNFSQLYLNAPGATNTAAGNFGDLRFNGRANQQNQTKLDGIEASAIFDASPGYLTVQGSQFRLQTSLENIQEFRVDSSNYPAEYGTGTGGQINVVGKSGGNRFSGSLFHYIRNDIFDARNFFDTDQKSALRLNQFGGSLGGPIIKNKLFFFGSYEGLRQRAGFNIIESTPSSSIRDFISLYNGESGNAAGIAARQAWVLRLLKRPKRKPA